MQKYRKKRSKNQTALNIRSHTSSYLQLFENLNLNISLESVLSHAKNFNFDFHFGIRFLQFAKNFIFHVQSGI